MITCHDFKAILTGIECSTAHVSKTNKSIHFKPIADTRANTVEYVIYKDNDGYYFRRMIEGMFYSVHPYQLFRAVKGNYPYEYSWKHFSNIGDAIDYFNNYLSKIVA